MGTRQGGARSRRPLPPAPGEARVRRDARRAGTCCSLRMQPLSAAALPQQDAGAPGAAAAPAAAARPASALTSPA